MARARWRRWGAIGAGACVLPASGVLASEGLVNRKELLLEGPGHVIEERVENRGTIHVRLGTARFRRPVTNRGSIKVTDSVVRFEAAYLGLGGYWSDPSDTYFTDLVIGGTGYLVGGEGDRFFVSGDFISTSSANTSWNTVDAYLEFHTGFDPEHAFHITGADLGAVAAGFTDNFAWGTLHVAPGNSLELFDGNAAPGGALYAEEVTGLALSGGSVTNVSGAAGVNVYYEPALPANAYLGGATYDFGGSGRLIPIGAEPPMVPVLSPLGAAALALLLARAGWVAGRSRRGGRGVAPA